MVYDTFEARPSLPTTPVFGKTVFFLSPPPGESSGGPPHALALPEVPAERAGGACLCLPTAPQRAQGLALQALQLREAQLVQDLVDTSHRCHLKTEGEERLNPRLQHPPA